MCDDAEGGGCGGRGNVATMVQGERDRCMLVHKDHRKFISSSLEETRNTFKRALFTFYDKYISVHPLFSFTPGIRLSIDNLWRVV